MTDEKQQKLTKKLQNDIAKVLKSSMPEYVCGVVRDRLEMADRLERELDELTDKHTVAMKELQDLRIMQLTVAANERAKDENNRNFVKLAEDIASFERNKRIYELEQQLKAQTTIAGNSMELVNGLTRNTEYRKNVYTQDTVALPGFTDQYGTVEHPRTESVPVTRDVTEGAS